MDNTYLFIQGPPGSGKTYITSKVILELIKLGKIVGVMSNSHKAINNLLSSIEYFACKENVSFLGVKKNTANNKETAFQGIYIKNVNKISHIYNNINLFAGTSWLFSMGIFDNKLDYIFVDEASQVSLANTLAISNATKNIVLIGDIMQLSNNNKNLCSKYSKESVLKYILQNQDIIPDTKGIFLSETYRLKSSICKIISQSFYNGRLKSNTISPISLSLKSCNLPNEGLRIFFLQHKNCYQKSIEESYLIKQKFDQLLGQNIIYHNVYRKITKEDIIIITPYNLQVNYLKSIFPQDTKIGTIDKFQGQESPIVFISMVSSDMQHLQKHLEFLYDDRRLNVAISRAQCLSLIVMSSNFLKVNCKTLKQVKIFNSFVGCISHVV